MGQDALETVVRDGVAGLSKYIQLLESLLASARAAEQLFRSAYAVEEMDPGGREASPSPPYGFTAMAGAVPPASDYDATYARLEAALMAERPRGHNRVSRGLRIIAAENGGELDFGLTCQLLRNTGICTGTPANVSSYISRRLRVSDEFQRIGEVGSGRYRWLSYPGDCSEDDPESVANDRGGSDSPETEQSPDL